MTGSSQLNFELITGYKMPMVGLGTYLIREKKLIWRVLDDALSIGYRLIDTAAMYGNEEELGNALKNLLPKHHLARQDIFIVSKLPHTHHGEPAVECLKSSLRRLQVDYLDLYLIHWPGSPDCSPSDPMNEILRDKSWSNLVEAKNNGLVRSFGVCNYSTRHLSELLANCFGEKPAVNQIEWHPHCHQDDMKDLCDRSGVLIQAYFSFGGSDNRYLLKDPLVIAIADKIGKSVPQVLLKWSMQQHIAVIPKATATPHLQANISLDFMIPPESMEQLSSLPQCRYGSDPNVVY